MKHLLLLLALPVLLPAIVPAALQAQNDTLAADTTQVTVDTTATDTARADTAVNVPAAGDKSGRDPIVSHIADLISFGVIFLILVILAVTYFVNRLLIQVIDNLAEKISKHRLAIKRSVPVVRITVWAFSLYVIIAGIIDPPFETVITVTATIGIAVGLASQDILKNIFGGFIIILDRPFQVGDKIEVGSYYGEVVQIGLRSTRIVTPDDSVVSLPNGDISNKSISNANSGALDCQVVAEIYLPAGVDINMVKRLAAKAAKSSRYVYLRKPVSVVTVNEIHEKNFVIKLRVKAYVLDIRYEFPFKSEMTELILTELNRRNIFTQPAGAGQ
ncbi:MAG: mechanosensitive ion channel [Balneolaceae bacterium]|nr:mechanosensitive ion channel [Balneolaceae bacterium]